MTRMFSARDLAALKLPGLPGALENCSRFIARVRVASPELVGEIKGRDGGRVVSALALPEAARAELARRAQAETLVQSRAIAEVDDRLADQRQIAARTASSLTHRQRTVMEARNVLLLAIEQRALAMGIGRSKAIDGFLADLRNAVFAEEQVAIVLRANDKAGGGVKLSRATLYQWFAERERCGIVGLAPRPTRQKADLPAWFDGFLRHYQRPSKPSALDALRAFTRSLPQGATPPTERQVRLALAKMPALAKLKGREGQLALRARMAYTARTFDDVMATSIYVADGKTFDAEIAHPIHGQPFRPELTTIIDVATRKAVGWSADLDENTFGVVDALRYASVSCGIPAIFYTDRGPGYRNKLMDAALTGFLGRAGITPMRALPYNSQAKGVVERLNQIYTATAKALPSYIGKDMDKQAKNLVHRRSRQELRDAGSSRVILPWADFLTTIAEAIDAYNNRPHSELPKILDTQLSRQRPMTPNELWAKKSAELELVIPDDAEVADMFRPYVKRRTRRALVEWLGNSYFAPELEALDGTDVVVGYDIHDASRVFVREIDEVDGELKPGRLIAIAIFNGHATRYVPLSYEQAAMERRAKGRIGRLQKKLDVVQQELRPAALLDHAPQSFSAFAPVAPGAEEAAGDNTAPQPAPAAAPILASQVLRDRPIFHDDVGFARWLVDNPGKATSADRILVADLLMTHSTNELLRMSGVDLEALTSIAKSNPEQTGAAAERDLIP